MRQILMRLGTFFGLALAWIEPGHALDSYRFLHVTIDTPWTIFLFLFLAVMAPFVLMAILVWRYAEPRVDKDSKADQKPGESQE